MAVSYHEEEVVFLAQVFLDAADDHPAVGVAYFLGDHANGKGAFVA